MHELFSSDPDRLPFYSIFNCIPGVDHEALVEHLVSPWLAGLQGDSNGTIQVDRGLVLFSRLEWDSEYFGVPLYKLHAAVGVERDAALTGLIEELSRRHETFNIYADVASEHLDSLQAMTSGGFRLVETRVTFVRDQLSSFDEPRQPVRRAELEDIPVLRDVAAECANPFDRIHADKFFSKESADEYLATYVENAIRGFADVVLVPDAPKIPAKAFVAGNYSLEDASKFDVQVSRFVLAAVDAECRGWFRKLSSEMTYDMRAQGADAILMTTQTANRAAIRAMENLGYRIGTASHVLAYSQP